MTAAGSANIIGLGLIGGSIAAALRQRGWTVHGDDQRVQSVDQALRMGVIDHAGLAPDADITFVAVPVSAIPAQVERALASTTGLVTDVGSVKSSVVDRTSDTRFIGGHPMAGSELDGIDGADADLFIGAVWVVTPRADADDVALSRLSAIVRSLGAEVVALSAARHDEIVAVVSHVPHLAAATLMRLAVDRSEEHTALLRLAAGGFRDMTRIASGRPEIWLDICGENRTAIVDGLSGLIRRLDHIRSVVDDGDHGELERILTGARDGRTNLPGRVTDPEQLAEIRIPIPDRTGAAAEVFTLAADLDVNIANFEVVHLATSQRGVAVVLVDQTAAERFRGGLLARGYRPSVTHLA